MRTLLILASLAFAVFGKKTYEGHQVLRITAADDLQIDFLKNVTQLKDLKLDFWREPSHKSLPVDVLVPSTSLQNLKNILKNNNLHYETMIPDVQGLLDEEQLLMNNESRSFQPENTNDFDYEHYHTLSEINSFIDMMVKDYPTLVSKIVIGKSYEGRPLNVLKFSTGTDLPGIWIDTGIHAREWVSHTTGTWLAKKLAAYYKRNATLHGLMKTFDIFLEIVTNPDGYEYTHKTDRMWRKTRKPNPGSSCVGVDPNRNWDSDFGGPGSSNDPCDETYHGPEAHSESEVKAIVDFIKSRGNFKAFVSIHSYSQLLLYPYGYTRTPCRDQAELHALAKKATTELRRTENTDYRYGSIINTIYQASGGSIDWAYDQGIKYSYTFELRDKGHYGFLLPANQIIPTAEETYFAILTIMDHIRKNPF